MTSPPPQVDGHALLDRFRGYLRDHNLPITHPREAVASLIFFSGRHLSVEDIERGLADRDARVGKATIYRTLELMTTAQVVQEHDFGEGFKRYEPLVAQSHHEHLICVGCGRVVEFSSERLERMNALIAEEHGFRHDRHRLEIYGLCHPCQRRDAEALRSETLRPEEPAHD
ncbi:MAG TPA: Fur family transcriptional regulator [Gemmatimonadales bacterium]